jgi:hypothetical protein
MGVKMRKRILIILITTLVTGAIAQGVMWDIGLIMNDYNEQVLRRNGRKTRRKRERQFKPFMYN